MVEPKGKRRFALTCRRIALQTLDPKTRADAEKKSILPPVPDKWDYPKPGSDAGDTQNTDVEACDDDTRNYKRPKRTTRARKAPASETPARKAPAAKKPARKAAAPKAQATVKRGKHAIDDDEGTSNNKRRKTKK